MGCRRRPKRHLGTPPTAQKRQKRSLRGGCDPFLRGWYPSKADRVLSFCAYFEHFSLRLSSLDDPRHFFTKGSQCLAFCPQPQPGRLFYLYARLIIPALGRVKSKRFSNKLELTPLIRKTTQRILGSFVQIKQKLSANIVKMPIGFFRCFC